MNVCERLEAESCKDGVDVIECNFNSPKIKGLYCNGTIGINSNILTSAERSCIIAEELGHHNTTVGNILDLSNAQNRKQERQARLWAYNKQIGLSGLIRAYEAKCRDWHEVADYLEVTEEFLRETIACYKSKYGAFTTVDNYTIYFIPYLAINKMI